jgi:HPt (histidine-containing phosphotransfer) domain-containing protein
MLRNQLDQPAIYSKLAADPILMDLIAEFVAELPTRAVRLRRHLGDQDWTALKRTAHQLKGAAGSYGFDAITPVASRLEHQINHGVDPRVIAETVQELVSLCQRASAGVPAET